MYISNTAVVSILEPFSISFSTPTRSIQLWVSLVPSENRNTEKSCGGVAIQTNGRESKFTFGKFYIKESLSKQKDPTWNALIRMWRGKQTIHNT